MSEEDNFLTEAVMSGTDFRALELAVFRLLVHFGFQDVRDVAGPGDHKADVLARYYDHERQRDDLWVFQCKAKTGNNLVGMSGVSEVQEAQSNYGARRAVLVTNGDFTHSVKSRVEELNRTGQNLELWNGNTLRELLKKCPSKSAAFRELRPEYQSSIVDTCLLEQADGRKRCWFAVATGLGKTVIASELVARLIERGFTKVLVLCHARPLAEQLLRDFGSQLPKQVPCRLFMPGSAPSTRPGVTFGLHQSLSGRLPGVNSDAWDIVIVDEAHHAPAETFSDCLNSLKPKFLVGMTATPFRGDGQDLGDIFGKCVSKVSLVDGMSMGFLAKVDYRLMCDNIDWDEVESLAQSSISIKDLNSKLFIRQRDEEIIAEIKKCCNTLDAPPRIIVFSPTCVHAAEFADLLCDRRLPAVSVSTGDKWETHKGLARFAVGDLKAVTAVDILNEGIDVPDVNVVVFLRATHSRRIFIQQLGRGLRIKPGIKEKVVVLDFVTDVRRIAAVTALDREARSPARRPGPGEIERVDLSNGVVSFSNEKAEEFIKTWIEEVADLDFCDDREKMQFPKT